MIRDLAEHGAIPRRFPGISRSIAIAGRHVRFARATTICRKIATGLAPCLLRS